LKRAGNVGIRSSPPLRDARSTGHQKEPEWKMHFVAGLRSLTVRSSREHAFLREISVAGPGSGGIDTIIWLSNRMGPTRAAA
jgi:hypothetical protein